MHSQTQRWPRNPYNGIERYREVEIKKARVARDRYQNPYNGIERTLALVEAIGEKYNRIHTMELKVHVLLQTPELDAKG